MKQTRRLLSTRDLRHYLCVKHKNLPFAEKDRLMTWITSKPREEWSLCLELITSMFGWGRPAQELENDYNYIVKGLSPQVAEG